MKKQQESIFENKSSEDVLTKLLLFVMQDKEDASLGAKALLRKYGSFSSVIEAPESELSKTKGISADTAEFLHTLQNTATFYLEDKNSSMKRIFDTESACEVLAPKFIGKKRELVALLLLDARGRILYNGIVNEGAVSEVPVYVRRIVELCLIYDAHSVIMAHNHPSGNPSPSRNDLNSTRDIEFALNGIDVTLSDHIIFGGEDFISLKSAEWLERIKEEVIEYKETLKEETREEEKALFGK